MNNLPVLWVVIPCYNEEEVLPVTSPMFLKLLEDMIKDEQISDKSRILFVNDGSKDKTWQIIYQLSKENKNFKISAIEKGKRFRDYYNPLNWLREARIIYPIYQLKEHVTLPLKSAGIIMGTMRRISF